VTVVTMGRAALQSMPRVFITGLGFVTSIGNDAATVAGSLRELRHGIELYPPFQKPEIACKVIGTVKGFFTDSVDPEDWTWPAPYEIKRETIRSMAPHGLYAHCAFLQAVADSRLSEADISNRDTGLYAASGGSPMLTYYHHDRMLKLGPARCSPLGIVASIVGTLNFNLVAAFRIQGASCGFSSACASSAHAMAFAFDEISLGRQKRMFVVGGEDGNRDAILPFAGMRTLSLQTDPGLASRPFDLARDGFVGTGGGVVVVLESEDEVARRAVAPYCEILGWGQASDGYNVAISHPDGTGSRVAMENALAASRVAPGEVDYVNAHATSTLIGDVSEARALRAVFGEKGARPAISSTKALTGHGLSLAGAMEVGFCALSMREGFIPGSAHISNLDPECHGLNIVRSTVSGAPRVVMKNSSGFGGANVALLMRRT
jgi:3-oxoacyl-[acyl-carrier-protein] synthase-1